MGQAESCRSFASHVAATAAAVGLPGVIQSEVLAQVGQGVQGDPRGHLQMPRWVNCCRVVGQGTVELEPAEVPNVLLDLLWLLLLLLRCLLPLGHCRTVA